jgi:hypothetical protein
VCSLRNEQRAIRGNPASSFLQHPHRDGGAPFAGRRQGKGLPDFQKRLVFVAQRTRAILRNPAPSQSISRNGMKTHFPPAGLVTTHGAPGLVIRMVLPIASALARWAGFRLTDRGWPVVSTEASNVDATTPVRSLGAATMVCRAAGTVGRPNTTRLRHAPPPDSPTPTGIPATLTRAKGLAGWRAGGREPKLDQLAHMLINTHLGFR